MAWTKPYKPAQRLDPALYASANRVVFITICSYQKSTPFVHPERNRAIIDCLQAEQTRNHCRIFTYCLMPDHLHYLISPEKNGSSVFKFTDQFKGKTTNLSWKYGWRGKLWQPRSYDHIVRTEEDLRAVAQYILNNPVRKGLVHQADEWPWLGQLYPLP